MKKHIILFLCVLLSLNAIAQTLTGPDDVNCNISVALTLQNSEADFNYFLSKSEKPSLSLLQPHIINNEKVGPLLNGTGSTLQFTTGIIGVSDPRLVADDNFEVVTTTKNYALEFDGTDDYVEIPHHESLQPTTAITIEAWVRPTDLEANGGFQEIYRKDNTGTGRQLLSFQDNGNTLAFGIYTNIYHEFDVPINKTDFENQWTHIMATYDGTAMYVYINGEEEGRLEGITGNLLTPPTPTNAYIGSFGGTTEFFKGQIAALRVWNKSRAIPNFASIFVEIIERDIIHNFYTGEEEGLIAYYPFFEGTGSQLTDVAINDVNNTASNGTIVHGTNEIWSATEPGYEGGMATGISNEHGIDFLPNLFVDQNATGDGTGCDWANAYTTINAALAAIIDPTSSVLFSDSDLPTIHVAQGTYAEPVDVRTAIDLIGGYPTGGGERNPKAYPTNITSGPTNVAMFISNVEDTIFIRGFTIKDSPTGISLGSVNLYIEECIIEGNNRGIRGLSTSGGLGNITLVNSEVRNNSNNTANLINNTTTYIGGAGIIADKLTLINSKVSNNIIDFFLMTSDGGSESLLQGGAGILANDITLINSEVNSNAAVFSVNAQRPIQVRGGGIFAANTLELINSNVVNNLAFAEHGTFQSNSTVSIVAAGGGIYAENGLSIQNSILWGNTQRTQRRENNTNVVLITPNEYRLGIGADAAGEIIEYSILKQPLEGSNPSGSGNIDATVPGFDPLFVDELNRDYRLQEGSPLIDVGNDAIYNTNPNATTEDLDGNVRFVGTIDMGPYEVALTANCSGITTTFNGTSWDNNIPTPNDMAIIAGDYSTTNGNIEACTIVINTDVTLTVSDHTYVRVVNHITNNGTLNVTNTGSVVQVQEDAVTINNGFIAVAKTTPTLDDRNFVAMSSPVTAEARDRVYGNSRAVFSIIPQNFSPFDIDLMAFPEFIGAENFLDDNNDYLLPVTGSSALPSAGIGQLIFPQPESNVGDGTYTLTYTQNPMNPGTLNSGTITVPINYNGPATTNNYNLLGNPYASAIDVTAFINANDAINEVYYWDHITIPSSDLPGFGTSNFSMNDISIRNAMMGIAAVNGGTEPGQFMASGQGFAIKADQAEMVAGTPVVFTNSIRVTGNNDGFRSSETANNLDKLWFNLTTTAFDEAISQTGIGFTPDATAGFDYGFDSARLGTFLSLFTTLETGEQLAIQGREAFDVDMEIALGFSSTIEENASYTIDLNKLEGIHLEETPIFLIDNLLGTVTNLKETSYSFTSERGIQPERFTVVFKERDVLNVDGDSFRESGINLYPNPSNGLVTLAYTGTTTLENAVITDVNGKIIKRIDLTHFNQSQTIHLDNLARGIYFMHITSQENTVVKKLMLR